jgi:glycosyltransferase involved in cell wall biosynthesis
VKLWPFRYFALTNVIVARPLLKNGITADRATVSVVVPARNEAGNVARIVQEIPQMGRGTEVIFVEGHSRDGTFEAIEAAISPGRTGQGRRRASGLHESRR